MKRLIVLAVSHLVALAVGFAAGVYFLPILVAPDAPDESEVQAVARAAEFNRLKSSMVRVGDVKTFENFIVPVAASVDPGDYTSVIIWCESFGEFITAAKYR